MNRLFTLKNKGFSILEIIIAAGICVVVIVVANQFFTKGQYIENIFASHEPAEHGWQRFIQRLREDIRSASEARIDNNRLSLTVNNLSSNGALLREKTDFFFDPDSGYLVIKTSEGEKSIEFAAGKKHRGQVVFSLNSPGKLQIKASIEDLNRKSQIFSREERFDFNPHD